MGIRWWFAFLLLALASCAPRLSGVDPARPPNPDEWGPKPAPIEWWYVSAYLPEAELAFHWAFFKVYAPKGMRIYGIPARRVFPYPVHIVHLAVTDLAGDELYFEEHEDFEEPTARVLLREDPLLIAYDDWRLWREGEGFRLVAGPLNLWLYPLKPPVVHPPGYSGTEETGRMYYVSYTRLALSGEIAGKRVRGYAWMDHQWGEQSAGRRVGWDWFGLHLSDGSDLMLYRVRDLVSGRVLVLHASRVDPFGRVEKLEGVRMTPLRYWTSERSGYRYAVAWRVEAGDLELVLNPLREEQELLTETTGVAYWEGPVEGEGRRGGLPLKAHGMGEFVGGPWPR